MSIQIKVPAMGESVTEATVARWFKKEGDAVARDEPLVELETDKVTVEVPAPADGAIESIAVQTGATVQVGSILGAIAEGSAKAAMTRLRRTIALRLKESQNTAAQLTTFNEVDMSHVMALRSEYKDSFEKKHRVRLGFMGFFVKACIAALKELPSVNGEIEGDDIV